MSFAPKARDQCEQVQGGRPDAVAPQLARRVVGEILVEAAETGVEAPCIVEVQEELADVPGGVRHGLRVVVTHVSISSYSALSVCVQDVEVPTIR